MSVLVDVRAMQLVVPYILPITIIAISVPMALGKVPPNGAYGFRTPKTLSSPDIWYPANRIAGWFLVAAGALGLATNVWLTNAFQEIPERTLIRWMSLSDVALILIGVAASLLYLRRL